MSDFKIDEIRRQLLDITPGVKSSSEPSEDGKSFSDVLGEAVEQVNQEQVDAENKVKDFVAGNGPSLHETLISLEKADVSFKMMMQVRNKLLDAYSEIMRTQV